MFCSAGSVLFASYSASKPGRRESLATSAEGAAALRAGIGGFGFVEFKLQILFIKLKKIAKKYVIKKRSTCKKRILTKSRLGFEPIILTFIA